MHIAVPKEIRMGERRVALAPDSVTRLVKAGHEVTVEAGAGAEAFFSDDAYVAAGAQVLSDTRAVWQAGDIVVKVNAPQEEEPSELDLLREGSAVLGLLNPLGNPMLIQRLADRKVTGISMELVPRISRAQSMDALSSQASVAGYRAVLEGAQAMGKFLPMLTTAAGTMPPAKVLVIGVGVAGLQAIATARRLGAVVEAFDIRPAAKEEVQSLGAQFIDITLDDETTAAGGYAREVSEDARRREHEVLRDHVGQSDIVITAALVPGRKAPVLLTEDMVDVMGPGSVVVDLAAEQGGNCALTISGESRLYNGVTIIGMANASPSMPTHASLMYSRNVLSLLQLLSKDGLLQPDFNDEIVNAVYVTSDGEIRHEGVRAMLAESK